MSTATVLSPEPAAPSVIHSCPNCSHWLSDGTLACPDCQTLTYGQHLSALAFEAQQLEGQKKFAEARSRWLFALKWLPAETRQAGSIRDHIATLDARLAAEDDRKARWTKRLGPLAPIALFLLKFKTGFFLLFKLKFLFSFLLSFGWYSAFLGWRLGLGLVITVLLHEMGHYIAIKRRGLTAEMPVFIPGFGAYVRWYDMGVSREDLASISLAGPLFGLLCAAASWGIYAQTHASLFLVLANMTAWYNLLNLIPVFGLDGAKAALGLTQLQRWLVAVAAIVFFALASAPNPAEWGNVNNHYTLLILAACMLWQSFRMTFPEEPSSFTMTYFLGVMLLLALVLHLTGTRLMQLPEMNGLYRVH